MTTFPAGLLRAAAPVTLLASLLAQDPAAATPPANQQEPVTEDREWLGGAPLSGWSRLTGDWAGHRTWLEEHGIEVGGGLTVDWAAPWHGGLRQRDSVVSMLDVNAAFDLETLLGWSRTLAFVDAYQLEGRDPSGDVGDIQSISNIQADDTRQIAEAWVETWLCDQLRLKLGKIDFNSEFAFTEEGGEFVNSSAAITPTIVAYPTYPDPATAINLFWSPSETCYVGIGVFDGAAADGIATGRLAFSGFFESSESDAYQTTVEFGTSWTGGNSWGSGRLALGVWHHSASFTRFDGNTDRGTEGVYAILDQRVVRENPTVADDRQGLGLMATLSFADNDVAAIDLHAECGLTWTGLLDDRDDDALGLLVTYARLSDANGSPFPADETAFELLYKIQLTPAMSLKPDLQYIVHPGGDPTVDDALVGLLRLELTF